MAEWARHAEHSRRGLGEAPEVLEMSCRAGVTAAVLQLAENGSRGGRGLGGDVVAQHRGDLRQPPLQGDGHAGDPGGAVEDLPLVLAEETAHRRLPGAAHQPAQVGIDRVEPERVLGLVEDHRVAETIDRVADRGAETLEQVGSVAGPAVCVEHRPGHQAQLPGRRLARLDAGGRGVGLQPDPVHPPVGVGRLEADRAAAHLAQAPATAVQQLLEEGGDRGGPGRLPHRAQGDHGGHCRRSPSAWSAPPPRLAGARRRWLNAPNWHRE